MKINENCFEFNFLFSNNTSLSLYKLKSYCLYAFFNNMNKPFIYQFNFSFQQMKILYFISIFEYLTVFLKRLLYIKNDVVHLDYTYFDSFSNMTNNEIYKYYEDVQSMNNDNKLKEFISDREHSTFNSLSLKVCEPIIEVIDFTSTGDNIKIAQSNIKLKKDFISELIHSNININDWINIIYQHRREINTKYQVRYEETRNKKIRRQITTGNRNKDLHKVFNKFFKIS